MRSRGWTGWSAVPITVLFAGTFVLCLTLVITANYRSIPTHSVNGPRCDVILVLGYPADADGSPLPEQRSRVLEAVREYKAHVASRLIVSGGSAHNSYSEARSMATLAESAGVPPADILEEPQALNTIQNVFYSAEIMHAHSWRTVEVISSPSHLPRAAMILAALNREHPELAMDWSTHPAPWPPNYSSLHAAALYTAEASYCFRLRLFGFPRSRFLPSP